MRFRLLLLAGAAAGISLAFAAWRPLLDARRSALKHAATVRAVLPDEFSIRGYTSEIYRDRRLRARASVESVHVGNPQAIGPLSFGFLRSIDIRDVRIESFEDADASSSILADAIASLVPESVRTRTTRIDVGPLTLTRNDSGRSENVLHATRCRMSSRPQALVCRDGFLGDGEKQVPFREATLSNGQWTSAPNRSR